MPKVTADHIRWRKEIVIRFGFTGLKLDEAATLVKKRIRKQFPDLDKPEQCVYLVRLKGEVAVAYGENFSPVIYIGEGNAGARLSSHANWFGELLMAVPNAAIEVMVADCVRQNDNSLCQYVEADLLCRFINDHGRLPWFNQQREKNREGKRVYEADVLKGFDKRLGKVSGSRYIWAIRPTSNNSFFTQYEKGQYETT